MRIIAYQSGFAGGVVYGVQTALIVCEHGGIIKLTCGRIRAGTRQEARAKTRVAYLCHLACGLVDMVEHTVGAHTVNLALVVNGHTRQADVEQCYVRGVPLSLAHVHRREIPFIGLGVARAAVNLARNGVRSKVRCRGAHTRQPVGAASPRRRGVFYVVVIANAIAHTVVGAIVIIVFEEPASVGIEVVGNVQRCEFAAVEGYGINAVRGVAGAPVVGIEHRAAHTRPLSCFLGVVSGR